MVQIEIVIIDAELSITIIFSFSIYERIVCALPDLSLMEKLLHNWDSVSVPFFHELVCYAEPKDF